MPYDPALDVELAKEEVPVDGQVYLVSLRSYNQGEAKVTISLQNGRFPVKRMTPRVFLAVAEAVKRLEAAVPDAPGEPAQP